MHYSAFASIFQKFHSMRQGSRPSEFRESQKEVAGTCRITFRALRPFGIRKNRSSKVLNPMSELDEGLCAMI
jgi:hypothetical protein